MKVLDVKPEEHRLSLSIKALQAQKEEEASSETVEEYTGSYEMSLTHHLH